MSEDIENKERLGFIMKHGENTSERLAGGVLEKIADIINGQSFIADGNHYTMKVLGYPYLRDGSAQLIVDARCEYGGPFDHIEFTIRKTGWGRMV